MSQLQSDTDVSRRGLLSTETDPLLTNIEPAAGYQHQTVETPKDPLEGAALHRDEGDRKSFRSRAFNLSFHTRIQLHTESHSTMCLTQRGNSVRL
jgi:hypothetical protein